MRPQRWDPKQCIDGFSKLPNSPATRRLYQSKQELLGNEERKLLREFEVFLGFCQCIELEIKPVDVVMLDPNSV